MLRLASGGLISYFLLRAVKKVTAAQTMSTHPTHSPQPPGQSAHLVSLQVCFIFPPLALEAILQEQLSPVCPTVPSADLVPLPAELFGYAACPAFPHILPSYPFLTLGRDTGRKCKSDTHKGVALG